MKWPVTLVLALAVVVPARAQVVFRSAVDSVTVDVSVRQRGREVLGLTTADFELRDNGVVQQVTDVSREALPIDVTLVVDLSGSVQGPVLAAITRAIEAVGDQLRPIDRAAVFTFNNRVRLVRSLEPGALPKPFRLGMPGGQTSLFDAMTIALATRPEAGRRRMVIVFTDGRDGLSFADGPALMALGPRTDQAIFTVALAGGTAARPQRAAHETLFTGLAETTGGAMTVLQQDQDLGASFVKAFEDFRSSYVLRYAYEGPPTPGWHALTVKLLRRGDYEVRAREGYFTRE